MVRQINFLIAAAQLSLVTDLSGEDLTRGQANRLAVDVVTLRIGGDVRRVIVERTNDSISLAVRRAWLAEHRPALLKLLPLAPDNAPASEQLVERIDSWLADLGVSPTVGEKGEPYSPVPDPGLTPRAKQLDEQQTELLRVLQDERRTYQAYIDDPLQLPPGKGTPQARREAYCQLINRLDQWIANIEAAPAAAKPESPQQADSHHRLELIRILRKERQHYVGQNPADDAHPESLPEFVRVDLSRADAVVIFGQSEARRQLAIAAYQTQLPDVEESSVPELQRQLSDRTIDVATVGIDAAGLL